MKTILTILICLSSYMFFGQQKEVNYRYNNGQLKETGYLKNDKPDSLWRQYSIEGIMLAEVNYLNSYKEGMWRFWYPNGQKRLELNYKMGVKISAKNWDINGNLIEEKNY